MKFAIIEHNGYFSTKEINSVYTEKNLEKDLNEKNKLAMYKFKIWEIFTGSMTEVYNRINKIENEFFKVI